MKYENFDDWFHEMEGYSFRSERFFDVFKTMTPQNAKDWLRASWDCAREKEEYCEYCSDPELRTSVFNIKCDGCVKRMLNHKNSIGE